MPEKKTHIFAHEAIQLAADMLAASSSQQSRAERQQAQKIAGMMNDPSGKIFTIHFADQALRSNQAGRVADQINYLLARYGVPRYLAGWERLALRLGNMASRVLPFAVVPLILAYIRRETGNLILPGEDELLNAYIQQRTADATRLNINYLGEAILGEGEAERRVNTYLALLAHPKISYISVKISSIFSQINLLAFDDTLERIKARLRLLYRQAMAHPNIHDDGAQHHKMVNLDMEEYRDLHLTVEAFVQVLSEPEFHNYRAGIVLQAYLPDSASAQRTLTEWAIQRVAGGGAPIKLRLVKGANLAMEQVEASLHDWEQAPYMTKTEVDANFKRMVTYGCDPQRIAAVNLGIASHNLFDVAYALRLKEHFKLGDAIEFEMLEGMANHQARTVKMQAGDLLIYAPVVKRQDYPSAMAYFVRRLDENTAEQNFLHDLFNLEVGSAAWDKQAGLFLEGVEKMDSVSDTPRRTQNRLTEAVHFDPEAPFTNVADTDFSLPQNQEWVRRITANWQERKIDPIPLQINDEFIYSEHLGEGIDPAQPHQTLYTYSLAMPDHIEAALSTAVAAQAGWGGLAIDDRKLLLVKCAEELARQRGNLIGAMMRDGSKTVAEADPEVSEAIDFANYYARSFEMLGDVSQVEYMPLGTVLITPPWNFPLAIPVGGTLAALMAGNTVLLKPAPEVVLVAWTFVNALWDAGIPKTALQFVPTTDDDTGKSLVTDDRVNGIILTGAYDTARMFLGWKPTLNLLAETSGKNAMIVTAMADRDLAIKDLVKSAFGHSGQKCSAASLAILEAEVYDSPGFRSQLKDAAESLTPGMAHELSTSVTPVIREPDAKLKRGLTTLDDGESWLLEPRQWGEHVTCWVPGIRLDVTAGSFFHQTECFGPVLGLMRAENLDHAIDLANNVGYGLTSGLHSLDDREISHWKEHIEAGNLYVNRGTTGAIVQRQPFGGWKKSALGYAKAGGPNYVPTLGIWRDADLSDEEKLSIAGESYQDAWETHFSQEHDPSNILGESNVFRYRPLRRVLLRLTPDCEAVDVERVLLATQLCGVPLWISLPSNVDFASNSHVTTQLQDEEAFIAELHNPDYRFYQRVRALAPVTESLRLAAIETDTPLVDVPVVSNGRLELRHYLHEQAVSITTHRYGNIVGQP